MFEKSINYCSENDEGISCLLLCEVALGKMETFTEAKYLEKPCPNTHSTKGLGRKGPDPDESFYTNDGMEIPLGKICNYNYSNGKYPVLAMNEYIVYNEAQVRIRYLVQVKSQ